MKRGPKKRNLIDWRRCKSIELSCKGYTQAEIANELHVGIGTVNRDLSWYRDQVKESKTKFVERIQEERKKCVTGLDYVLQESWFMSDNAKDSKEKYQALSLAKECYFLKYRMLSDMPALAQVSNLESDSEAQLSKNVDKSLPNKNSGPIDQERNDKNDGFKRSEEENGENEGRDTKNETF